MTKPILSPDAEQRARRVEFILMDVDGVLTNGQILLVPNGDGGLQEIKSFNVQDGVGITFAHRAGLRTGILTGRKSESVAYRAMELGIELVVQGSKNKIESYLEILDKLGLDEASICYIGDDFHDFPMIRQTGFSVAVANAAEELKTSAHLVTGRRGGEGAVREALEYILRVQGKWDPVVARYLV